ncbi:hypothetical protein [Mycobacterium leprae]|uniref:hypothetical protein n=1 Tax=Mycobacterium leprae TaxID=1769 RepID=UPI001955020E|nr:hypothetical protein [Mycobacterium leprae]
MRDLSLARLANAELYKIAGGHVLGDTGASARSTTTPDSASGLPDNARDGNLDHRRLHQHAGSNGGHRTLRGIVKPVKGNSSLATSTATGWKATIRPRIG